MSYPARQLVSEPFVSQLETIDKTWIEVQNQPSSYFPRRNRPVTGQMATHQSPSVLLPANHYNKYGYSSNQHDYYNYRANMGYGSGAGPVISPGALNGVSGVSGVRNLKTSGLVADRMGPSHVSPITPVTPASAIHPVSNVPQIPEVFSEDRVFGKVTSPPFSDAKLGSFTTFDPFADSSGTLFQLTLFNSSNSILGSNFSSNSSNIWGNTTKSTDAAVWG